MTDYLTPIMPDALMVDEDGYQPEFEVGDRFFCHACDEAVFTIVNKPEYGEDYTAVFDFVAMGPPVGELYPILCPFCKAVMMDGPREFDDQGFPITPVVRKKG